MGGAGSGEHVARRQARVLRALADTIWPSQRAPADATAAALKRYYERSGADDPAVPAQALAAIKRSFMGLNKNALLGVLYLLSWPLTTLLLAGRHGLTRKFPFVLAFPDMSLEQREALLLAWRHSPLAELRGAFKAIKAVVISSVLTAVDDGGFNPFFEAVNYPLAGAAPPPEAAPSPDALKAEEVLATAVVDARAALAAAGGSAAGLGERLKRRGFKVKAAPRGGADAASAADAVELEADVVIVGSGAGGGVAAAQLAAAGLRVIVVEKGGWKRMEDLTLQEAESYQSMFERSAFLITEDGGMVILAGATMGGGTKINWCASLRTPDHVRKEWATEHGVPRFATPEFDSHLDAVLGRLGVATTTRQNKQNGALYDGLCAMGADARELPRNCASDECSGFCSLGCKTGHKASTDTNYLADAARKGARVLVGARARRVITEAGGARGRRARAVGVELRVGGDEDDFGSGVEVVVRAPLVVASAGSIHSPALLLRSGITCGGNVGSHLRLHPACGVLGRFEEGKKQRRCDGAAGSVDMFKGVMMLTYSLSAARWEEDGYGAMVSVPSLHPGLLAACHPWIPKGQYKEKLTSLQDTATSVIFARDCGSGRVTIDGAGRPRIHYWPNKKTREHMVDGIALALRAYVAAGATSVMVPHAYGDQEVSASDGPEALEALIAAAYKRDLIIHDAPLLSAHQMGSCRMGGSAKTSVCDGAGECWEVEGLYVADASAFPTASGVNPMITTMAISHMVTTGIAQRAAAARKAASAAAPSSPAAAAAVFAAGAASPSAKPGMVSISAGSSRSDSGSSDCGGDAVTAKDQECRDW